MVILSFFSFLGNPSEWWLHKGVVCHEDFSDPQHSHHHGVVLEAHHTDDTPTRPPGKVRPVGMMIRRRIMLIMMILVIARFKKKTKLNFSIIIQCISFVFIFKYNVPPM